MKNFLSKVKIISTSNKALEIDKPIKKIMKYKNYPEDFNVVAIKSRYFLNKITALMNDIKEEDYVKENSNEAKQRKIMQMFCKMKKDDEKEFMLPSDKVLKKIRQFKNWQNYEMFKKNGLQNYIDKLMPDADTVHNTRKMLEKHFNIYNEITIKPKNQVFPILNNNQKNILQKDELNRDDSFKKRKKTIEKKLCTNIYGSCYHSSIAQDERNSTKKKIKKLIQLSNISDNKNYSILSKFKNKSKRNNSIENDSNRRI